MPDDPRLPLFPLRTVLFPGGVLPLQIFEVRYLDMIGRCHRENRPFGVVCLTGGQEVRQREGEGGFALEQFHAVGTLAHIERLDRPQPGLLVIRCVGGQRFRLHSQERLAHGLWVGEAETLADDPPLAIPEDLHASRDGLRQMVNDLQAQGIEAADFPLHAPFRFDECGWVANRWCELLPLPAATRQQLMVVDSPLLRLELVNDALERLEQGGTA